MASQPERWLPVQGVAAAVAVILAMWGFALDGSRAWWNELYLSIALFAGDTTTLGHEHGLVTVARWLALAVTISAVVAVAVAVLRRRAGGVVSRLRARGHVVVAGNERTAARVAASMVSENEKVVLISQAPDAEEIIEHGVSVVFGHPAATRSLRAARVERAAVVIVAMGDDAETTHVALVVARLMSGGRVLGLMRDPVARFHLQARVLGVGGRAVELIALPEVAARRALSQLPPYVDGARAAAVVGTGPLAESVAVGIARLTRPAPGENRPRLLVAVPLAQRLARLAGIAERVEIVRVDGDVWEIGAHLRAAGGKGCCYLCPPASIGQVLAVVDAGPDDCRALLLMDEESEDVGRATLQTLAAMGDDRVSAIDVNAGAVGPELLSFGMIEEVARAKHEQYLRDAARTGRGSVEATRPWDDLTPEIQRSNRDFAHGLIAHLARTGRRLVPDSGLAHADGVASIFQEAEIEELARAEHDRWVHDMQAAGWKYAPVRDDANLLHDDLIPWDDLDEPTRDLDRDPMRDLGRILAAAGLRAVPIARSE